MKVSSILFSIRQVLLIIFTLFIDIGASDESNNYSKINPGQEVVEQDMDVISLSSSTLSDFDVISEEDLNFLKEWYDFFSKNIS